LCFQDTTLDHINPVDENLYPGVCKHYEELLAWDWIYGKTPSFSIHRQFTDNTQDLKTTAHVAFDVTKGRIMNPKIDIKPAGYGLSSGVVDKTVLLELLIGLQDLKFERRCVTQALSDVKMRWISAQQYDVDTHRTLDWVILCVIESTGLFLRESV